MVVDVQAFLYCMNHFTISGSSCEPSKKGLSVSSVFIRAMSSADRVKSNMKELYYYVPCEYWYDKQDRLRTDIEGRNTPMYMCECPTLAACIQWMIQTREYTFQTEQNVAVWHVVVRAGDYVLYDSESNADAFCCLEEALEKAVQECMELLY